jgi:hypothetical protein
MSYALVLSALLLLLVIAATIGVAVWWVRRPIPGSRGARGSRAEVLPLFSNAQAVVWRRPAHGDEPGGRVPVVQLDDA